MRGVGSSYSVFFFGYDFSSEAVVQYAIQSRRVSCSNNFCFIFVFCGSVVVHARCVQCEIRCL